MNFSIRDLLLVTVIVALAVGWWADRRDNGRCRTRAGALEHFLKREGWSVLWEADFPRVSVTNIETRKGAEIPTDILEPTIDFSFRRFNYEQEHGLRDFQERGPKLPKK